MIITAESSCIHGSLASALHWRPKYMPPSAISQTMAVCDSVAARPSSTACISVPRTAMMNAAIIVLECPGSSPCSAPSRIALGMNSHALPPASRVWKSVIGIS